MPRYFLDWSDGKELFHDEAGVELKTAQSIEAAAAKAIPDIARIASRRGRRPISWWRCAMTGAIPCPSLAPPPKD